MYSLTIANDTDACTGDYDSRLDAMNAANDAASYELPNRGEFVDANGIAYFTFTIERVA
jgi:hypothetical protein